MLTKDSYNHIKILIAIFKYLKFYQKSISQVIIYNISSLSLHISLFSFRLILFMNTGTRFSQIDVVGNYINNYYVKSYDQFSTDVKYFTEFLISTV